MRYLPMSYDTKNKNVLIVGGGTIALDRLKRLLESEFKIYIIADNFINEIIELSDENSERISIKKGKINKDFVFFGYDYLVIATHDFELNQALEIRAEKSKIPFERCDLVSNSNLLMNKALNKEGLTIGITTNGINPTITDIVYDDICKLLSKYSSEKISILNDIRKELVIRNDQNIDEKIRAIYQSDVDTLKKYLNNLESLEVRTEIVKGLRKELDAQIKEVMEELEKRTNKEIENSKDDFIEDFNTDLKENISKNILKDEPTEKKEHSKNNSEKDKNETNKKTYKKEKDAK